jgi:hypothetical protein
LSQPPTASKLRAAEDELLELATALDEPVAPKRFELSIVALGQRARTLYHAFLRLQKSNVPTDRTASRALMRPMIEINTLVRFLATNPDLHLELWEAEGDRNTVSIIEEMNEKHAERWGLANFSADVIAERKARVAAARKQATEAAVAGIGKKGSVMPGTALQLETIGDPAASEAYTFAYRPMTWDVHVSPRTFLVGEFEERNDGTVSYVDARDGKELGSRALALAAFASTLELVAHHLELGIEGDVHAILLAWAPEEIPAEQRLDALG